MINLKELQEAVQTINQMQDLINQQESNLAFFKSESRRKGVELVDARQRIVELEQERIELLSVVYNHCVGDVAMGYRIDAESLGQDIYSITRLDAEQVHQLRKQAEEL